jgi:hypothetical protein
MTPLRLVPPPAVRAVASITQQVRVRMARRARRLRWARVIDQALRELAGLCFAGTLGLGLWALFVTMAGAGLPALALALGLAVVTSEVWRRGR